MTEVRILDQSYRDGQDIFKRLWGRDLKDKDKVYSRGRAREKGNLMAK